MPLKPAERKANYDALKNFKLPRSEMQQMATAAGMLPSAIKAVVEECSGNFANDWVLDSDGMVLLAETGETMQEVIERWRTERPHLWPEPVEPTILDEAERAFGAKPSLSERGKFLRNHGAEQYHYYREMFGADASLRPGKLPEAGDGKAEPKPKASPNNPWSDDFPGGIDSAYKARASAMRGLGLKKCAELAAACGRTITGVPLRR